MKRYILQAAFFVVLCAAFSRAEETPPYAVQDPAVMGDFQRIYEFMDTHRHNDGAHIFISSGNSTTLDRADVYAGNVTIAANASVIVAVTGLVANFYPIFTEMLTSSKTVSCQVWASSFTLTNTSDSFSKSVNWWIFGRK